MYAMCTYLMCLSVHKSGNCIYFRKYFQWLLVEYVEVLIEILAF